MPQILEHDIQRAYIIWARGEKWERGPLKGQWKVFPALLPGVLCWSVPNGGNREGREAKRLKEEGVLPGVPDVHHLWGRLMCLEFKRVGGRLSDAQIALHPQLIAAGAWVETVDNLADAKATAIRWKLVRSDVYNC